MNAIIEAGHAKNVANLEDLISYCAGYGAAYNPSLAAIKLANLNAIKTSALSAIAAVSIAYTAHKNATNTREIVFLPVRKLSTRVVNALIASGVPKQTIKDARTINRKLQGARAKAKPKKGDAKTPVTSSSPTGPIVTLPVNEDKSISVSQQGYDSTIEYFGKLIDLVSSIAAYSPNEADLKVSGLNALLASMKTANTAVINATTAVSNSRITRNDILYKPVSGLVDISVEVKSYVKSVYGTESGQFKQVSKLQFKRLA
jgi:hypothetical protein